jgi:hypothetical protein
VGENHKVVYFNPEHIPEQEHLSDAYDERLSGVKAITHCIITPLRKRYF